jgi:Holin of 3TMs, for gene-transfer release
MDWKQILGSVAPTIAGVLTATGPVGAIGGAALTALSKAVLGKPDGTPDEVSQAITQGLSPDAIIAIKQADAQLQAQLAATAAQVQIATINADTSDTAAVNTTMQAESKADHWPTYSWRPFIGFAFGLLGLISGLTAGVSYLGVMFFGVNAAVLGQLPALIGSEAAVMATMAPVLGIASYFRGKMQADPNVQTDNRG